MDHEPGGQGNSWQRAGDNLPAMAVLLARILHTTSETASVRSRRRQSALTSFPRKSAPTDVGGYGGWEISRLDFGTPGLWFQPRRQQPPLEPASPASPASHALRITHPASLRHSLTLVPLTPS